MKKMLNKLLFVMILSGPLTAQTIRPLAIGDKVPERIWRTIVKTKDTKLVILDFWATSCGSCIQAFPKMEKLQQQFVNKLQVVLVNSWETDKHVKQRIRKFNDVIIRGEHSKKEKDDTIRLSPFSVINGDSILIKLFPVKEVPHHVWINDRGVVQAITYGYYATAEYVQAMLDGKKTAMDIKEDIPREELLDKGYLQPTLSYMPPVYYTAFIPFFKSWSIQYEVSVDSVKKTFRKTISGTVLDLFEEAYTSYGFNAHNKENIVIEVKNKEIFEAPFGESVDPVLTKAWSRKYYFTYEVQGPLKDKDSSYWKQTMQQDANRFFGSLFGIEGKLEKRGQDLVLTIKDK